MKLAHLLPSGQLFWYLYFCDLIINSHTLETSPTATKKDEKLDYQLKQVQGSEQSFSKFSREHKLHIRGKTLFTTNTVSGTK